jgi:hypothetical protein
LGAALFVGAPVGSVVGLIVDRRSPHRDVLYSRSPQARRWMIAPVASPTTFGARLIRRF